VLSILQADISIEPYFEGERLEGEFSSRLKTKLLWITVASFNAIREEKIRKLLINIVRRA
jgi:hypothetical protein